MMPLTSRNSERQDKSRYLVSAMGLLLFALVAFLYNAHHDLYINLLDAYHFEARNRPFVDLDAVLSVIDCTRKGLDVYATNPCDILGRLHDSSPLWLAAKFLPVTAAWLVPLGLSLDLGFLLSLSLLPPPRTRAEQWLRLSAVPATAVVFALERANVDTLLFILVILAGCILASPRGIRLLGYPLILLAGLLKYYPLAALLILLMEKRTVAIALGLCLGIIIAGFFMAFETDILRSLTQIPRASYINPVMFGAVNLPRGLAFVFDNQPDAQQILGTGLFACLGIASAIKAARLSLSPDLQRGFIRLGEAEKAYLLLGSLIIVGCFLAGQSIYYRAIFLWLALPGILALARDSVPCLRGLAPILVFEMWNETLAYILRWKVIESDGALGWHIAYLVFWLAREALWWWIATILLGIIGCFVRQSPLWRR